MITSMTGFGRGTASENGLQVTVEVKTLNGRYLDITSRLPSFLNEKELELKELIQKQIRRGKVHLNINLERSETGRPDVTYSPELVKEYGRMLDEIRKLAGIGEPAVLKDLTSFTDIFIRRREDEATIRKSWDLVLQAAGNALETAQAMRQNEGGQLRNELTEQLGEIKNRLTEIRELTKSRVPDAMERYRERIRMLIDDESIDRERLEQEIAILIDKMDIQEELIRLDSHLKFFLEALESSDAVGRRLNFLCQEINRELNTIGSKVNDSKASHLVVRAKEGLEQIREQVQNIE